MFLELLASCLLQIIGHHNSFCSIPLYPHPIIPPANMDTLLIFREVSDDALTRIKKSFSTVHYFPNPTPEQVDDAKLKDVDAIFMNWSGLPDDVVPSFKKTPKLKFLQLPSAGSERAVKAKAFQEQVEKGKQGEYEIKLCNASGIHVTSIPQWCIGQTISLLHQTQKMIVYAHVRLVPDDGIRVKH